MTYPRPHRSWTKLAALAWVALTLQGCASTRLAGGRWSETEGELPGIPLTLTKPTFKLTAERPTPERPHSLYSLQVEYVPDPDQRFTIRLDPALLTEADFKVLLGDLGQVTDLNSEARDQMVPTVKAIGSFLAKAVTAVATAGTSLAAFDVDAGSPEFFSLVETYLSRDCKKDNECEDLPDEAARCDDLRRARDAYLRRWRDVGRLDLMFPISRDEEILRDVAKDTIECKVQPYQAKLARLRKTDWGGNYTAGAVVERVAEASTLADLDAISERLRLARERDEVSDEVSKELEALLREASVNVSLLAASSELETIASSWRHAYASYLEREIDLQEREDADANATEPSTEVKELRRRWANVIGAQSELERADELRRALSAIAIKESQPARPLRETAPFADYEHASKELAALETRIAAKRAALVPPAKPTLPTPPAKRDLYPAVFWKTGGEPAGAPEPRKTKEELDEWVESCVRDPATCATIAWNQPPRHGAKPEFVIVVEKGVKP